MSNEHEDAMKLKLESFSTKLADDSVDEESRLYCMRHAFMAIGMPNNLVWQMSRTKEVETRIANAMPTWQLTSNCLKMLVLELV